MPPIVIFTSADKRKVAYSEPQVTWWNGGTKDKNSAVGGDWAGFSLFYGYRHLGTLPRLCQSWAHLPHIAATRMGPDTFPGPALSTLGSDPLPYFSQWVLLPRILDIKGVREKNAGTCEKSSRKARVVPGLWAYWEESKVQWQQHWVARSASKLDHLKAWLVSNWDTPQSILPNASPFSVPAFSKPGSPAFLGFRDNTSLLCLILPEQMCDFTVWQWQL